MLYKVLISRAFRHTRIDPRDIDLLGLRHKYTFLDVMLPFIFCHGSVFFTHCSNIIHHIMHQHDLTGLLNYIDDLMYTGLPSKIHQSYTFLLQLLQQLGLDISAEKLVPPSTSVIFLGILINTNTRIILIPEKKLQEIKNSYVILGKVKVSVTKHNYNPYLVLFFTKCVRPARFFLNRMLTVLRNNHNNITVK